MRSWLKALLSETVFTAWWALSGLSTLSTFFLTSLAGKPRLVLTIVTLAGFAWANFKVFQKQGARIAAIELSLESHTTRKSELRIRPDNGSRYILRPLNNVPKRDFNGAFLEFHLMVENTGLKNSTIDRYDVEILELQQTFPNLQPQEGRHAVQGRHCNQGLQPERILSKTGIIMVLAESATVRGILLFFVPDLELGTFVKAGLKMSDPGRRFGALHCRLKLTDTTKSSATEEFELHEA
jgi:hypothetical protein